MKIELKGLIFKCVECKEELDIDDTDFLETESYTEKDEECETYNKICTIKCECNLIYDIRINNKKYNSDIDSISITKREKGCEINDCFQKKSQTSLSVCEDHKKIYTKLNELGCVNSLHNYIKIKNTKS